MVLRELSEVVGGYAGFSRKVLELALLMKRLVDEAKRPGFSQASWAPLAELVAVDEFERVGNFLEVMRWPDYVAFLIEVGDIVGMGVLVQTYNREGPRGFLELEERSQVGEHRSVVNSVSVYEFNHAGKLRHLDIYLQMKMPDPEMLKAYS